jgi:hypothetical protein
VPEVRSRDRAVGAPGFTDGSELGVAEAVLAAVGERGGALHADVGERQHVGPEQVEDQLFDVSAYETN